MGFMARKTAALNDWVARSIPNARKNARFTTEMLAGLITFLTMAYIIDVNASILADSGVTCVCNDPVDPKCNVNDEYAICMLEAERDLITSTSAISALASFLMGIVANLPVGMAPAMGLNAYLAYQVVGFHGSGPITYRVAMTSVFVEGIIFTGLSLLGIRQWLNRIIPASIKMACGGGIGLFLALLGLSYTQGVGAVTGGDFLPLELAGCPDNRLDPVTGLCTSGRASSPTMWVGFIAGGVFTAILITHRVRGAMMIGILLVSIVSWPRDTSLTYFPRTAEGNSRFNYFKNVVEVPSIRKILVIQDWDLSNEGWHFALAVFTMLYVDILNATGSLYSMARFSGIVDPDTGDFPRSALAYTTDSVCIVLGSLVGVSPVTVFVESGTGIAEGGRTGLAACMTAFCFIVSLFFGPIFASIPPWATGGTLIIVGCMMMRGVANINWKYPGDCIPAFVTLIFMPFSFSLAYGLIAGIITYAGINSATWFLGAISGGRFLPPDYDDKEYWSLATDYHSQPWVVRAIKGDRHFWKDEEHDSFELSSTEVRFETTVTGGSKVKF
ncbi:hypothetical protein COCC4DRAFT_66668 [Bipolaris maydis ATCC 48331]|uniref:Xanthine/uracil permease n=2 Tax=Cochliobolus heterostrophus TaxID=5016 RepID=M2TEZ2_COCH5|nr:uncharacterized protein COCC4DRAFT_66668 [Bipolaris maydis ATCC 48331]EMD85089.1 hypothetical protein COCHEDRAFT_1119995 [Bipolaris maydis C5]ENH99247.1 hypothetical protein COCC4DRAFT_66668 [Bipolaris maydis ATCC 48331]KAJ6205387.1 purine transporter [Bipolaris maydis]